MIDRLMPWLLNCRLFESVTTFIMLGMAATLVFSPAAIEKSNFRYLLAWLTPLAFALFLALVGGVRCVALYANGRWPAWGPRLRAAGALGGAFVWCWLAFALGYTTAENGFLSLSVVCYVGLSLGEMVSCARAGSDVRAGAGS